jgi:outer membrane lipoprotein SlyB
MNDRKVDITVDKDGNTLVNGQKMDEQELDNGTKVFIFRNSEAKKSEA